MMAKWLIHTTNFNSHAHVERDEEMYYKTYFPLISTHTLTWSVTVCYIKDGIQTKFQLTRSRGA